MTPLKAPQPLPTVVTPTIRTARLADVPQILALVNDHVRKGDLLPRTAASIRETIDDWFVAELDGSILACVSLLYYSPTLAEVRSLAVANHTKGMGLGSQLVQHLIDEAAQRQIPTLFALTRAVRFFAKLGFAVTDKVHFPQKVWRDCHVCPIMARCDETAVVIELVESNGRGAKAQRA